MWIEIHDQEAFKDEVGLHSQKCTLYRKDADEQGEYKAITIDFKQDAGFTRRNRYENRSCRMGEEFTDKQHSRYAWMMNRNLHGSGWYIIWWQWHTKHSHLLQFYQAGVSSLECIRGRCDYTKDRTASISLAPWSDYSTLCLLPEERFRHLT